MKTTSLVYHGSPHKFDKFSFHNVGKESGTTGAGYGLYFSESKADALTYGGYLYTCLLQLKNKLSNTKVTIKLPVLQAIIDDIAKLGYNYWENWGEITKQDSKVKILKELISYTDSDTEIIGDIVNSTLTGNVELMMETLTKYGYSHTIDKITPEDKTITHYIVYDVNSIKIQKIEKIL